ncbi:exported protein of unknown function [Nitrosotalea devaniterrae]|uniref:Uncharacterized protein n=1 Tax=Nitrosotalea devaniterrae TaxID=1078905 RepID=A0A128A220_9ARCH|nr:exported protein of unknown function [Candidatus Nitrosotalea devanaterra]
MKILYYSIIVISTILFTSSNLIFADNGTSTDYGNLPELHKGELSQSFDVDWNQQQYHVSTWTRNGTVTSVNATTSGIEIGLAPSNDGILIVQLPRDIFEHKWVGLANIEGTFDYELPKFIRVGLDCNSQTLEGNFTSTTRTIHFENSFNDYYTGPGGPVTHHLAGTSFSDVPLGGSIVPVESEQKICGWSYGKQGMLLQVKKDSKPDFMQIQLQSETMGKHFAVFANNIPIPFNQIEDRGSITLNFTYPPYQDQITVNASALNDVSIYSPKKQSEFGISPFDIICTNGLEKVIKTHDGFAACVFAKDKEKLYDIGWADKTSVISISNPQPTVGQYFEAGGILFNVTSVGASFIDSESNKEGAHVIVNMTAQSLRHKPVHVDNTNFALDSSDKSRTVQISQFGSYNSTAYTIPDDHPTNLQFSFPTWMKKSEFGLKDHSLIIYLKSNDGNVPIIPLEKISCQSGDVKFC